jgi:hypothetical protein
VTKPIVLEDDIPVGNVYDKYATRNPIARRLVPRARLRSLHGHGLREVARLIDVASLRECDVIREQL